MHRRAPAAAAALAVLLSSCTTADDRPRAAPSTAAPSTAAPSTAAPSTAAPSTAAPSTTGAGTPSSGASESQPPERPRLPAAARPPREGACYRIGFEEATTPTSDADPVRCTTRHTARTFFVGRLDTVVDGHLLAVDSRVAEAQVARTCPRRLDRFVGGSPRERRLSRLETVWFSPTLEQSDQGATWFRCDVVALGRGRSLAPLPGGLRGVLDRPRALDKVGLCGTAEPGSRGFERVICSQRHAWQAVTTIDIPAGSEYPGTGAVREAGEERCRDVVAEASGSPDRFRYGWEWPTRAQWRSGQRYGFCWAPD